MTPDVGRESRAEGSHQPEKRSEEHTSELQSPDLISWRVIPLSRRPGLMCDYTGRKDDPLQHSRNDLPEDVAEDMTKDLLNESLADCGRTGLSPFCKTNPAPAVSR